MKTISNMIACEPIAQNRGIKTQRHGGLNGIQQMLSLITTKVVFMHQSNQHSLPVGANVYLRGTAANQHWAINEMELDGVKFVLIPESEVIMVDYK